MAELGRTLLALGLLLAAIGAVLLVASRAGGLPFGLGRLPGDIVVERENFRFYFPLTTSLVVSVVVSLLFYVLSRRR